jgi:hypothetical protein
MDVRITSVTWEAAGPLVAAATEPIEGALRANLNSHYGLEVDLLLVVISVSDDPLEQEKFAKTHTRLGSYERWPSTDKRRLWSLPLEFPRAAFEAMSLEQMRSSVASAIRHVIDSPPRKPPKSFDLEKFQTDVTSALAGIGASVCNGSKADIS